MSGSLHASRWSRDEKTLCSTVRGLRLRVRWAEAAYLAINAFEEGEDHDESVCEEGGQAMSLPTFFAFLAHDDHHAKIYVAVIPDNARPGACLVGVARGELEDLTEQIYDGPQGRLFDNPAHAVNYAKAIVRRNEMRGYTVVYDHASAQPFAVCAGEEASECAPSWFGEQKERR